MDVQESKKIHVEISTATIFKVLAIFAVLFFLFLIKDVIAIVLFAVLLILIIQPAVSWMNKELKMPRALTVVMIYILLIGFFSLAITLMVKPVSEQISQMGLAFQNYSGQLESLFGDGRNVTDGVKDLYTDISLYFPTATSDLVHRLTGAVGVLVSIFVVLIITFYGLVEESAFRTMIRSTVPSKFQPYLYHVAARIQKQLGLWLRGQLILAATMFVLTYIGLTLLGVKYALALALISGILELIPYVGPILSGSLAVFLNVLDDPIKGLLILALYVVIQQTENHILVPKVMQKTTGLNPIVSIIALLIGAKLGGVMGIILAIPVANIISVFVNDFMDQRQAEQLHLETDYASN